MKNACVTSNDKVQRNLYRKLKLELAHLRRIRVGIKSETPASPQGQLFEELHNIAVAIIEQEIAQLSQSHPTADAHQKESTKRQGAGRQVLPANLPRIDHLHDLPEDQCQCKKCGFKLVKISEDITEKLAVIPAQFIVNRHIRPQYACNACETIQIKPVAPEVIDGSYCTPDLAAWIICNKYLDHLPLYRQE